MEPVPELQPLMMAYRKGPIKRRYFDSLFNSSPAQLQSELFLKAISPRAMDSLWHAGQRAGRTTS